MRAAALPAVILLFGCGDQAASGQGGAANGTSVSEGQASAPHELWTLPPTRSEDLKEALTTCLSIIRDGQDALIYLGEQGWTNKPFPDWVKQGAEQPIEKKVYQKTGQTNLIALGAYDGMPTCSVLTAADSEVLASAINALPGDFAKGMDRTPHGAWWTFNGVRIDNDYADNYVFEPDVFDSEDFYRSEMSDVRVYKCEKYC